jgi:hypothetical protein
MPTSQDTVRVGGHLSTSLNTTTLNEGNRIVKFLMSLMALFLVVIYSMTVTALKSASQGCKVTQQFSHSN